MLNMQKNSNNYKLVHTKTQINKINNVTYEIDEIMR